MKPLHFGKKAPSKKATPPVKPAFESPAIFNLNQKAPEPSRDARGKFALADTRQELSALQKKANQRGTK